MSPWRRSPTETQSGRTKLLGDRCIEKADPNSTSITTMHPPTRDTSLVTPQNEFVSKPLSAFRDADLELDDVEI